MTRITSRTWLWRTASLTTTLATSLWNGGAACAQEPERESIEPAEEAPVVDSSRDAAALAREWSLSGRVLDFTHRPIEGAKVEVRIDQPDRLVIRAAESARDGSYRVTGLAPPDGRGLEVAGMRLEVRHSRFAPCFTAMPFYLASRFVEANDDRREYHHDVYLGRGATVRGLVVDDETDAPIPGAIVEIEAGFSAMYWSSRKAKLPTSRRFRHETLARTVCGNDGTFEFTQVPVMSSGQMEPEGGCVKSDLLGSLRAVADRGREGEVGLRLPKEGSTVTYEVRCRSSPESLARRVVRTARSADEPPVTDRLVWKEGDGDEDDSADEFGRERRPPPAPNVAVVAKFLDARTREPVTGECSLALGEDPSRSGSGARWAGAGLATLDELPLGVSFLSASAEGHDSPIPETILVDGTARLLERTFVLEPRPMLHGRVRARDGRQLHPGSVFLSRDGVSRVNGTFGLDGTFVLEGLERGACYTILFIAHVPGERSCEWVPVDPFEARIIADRTESSLSFEVVKAYSMSLEVEGERANDSSVSVTDDRDREIARVDGVASKKDFRFWLPPGDWTVVLSTPGLPRQAERVSFAPDLTRNQWVRFKIE